MAKTAITSDCFIGHMDITNEDYSRITVQSVLEIPYRELIALIGNEFPEIVGDSSDIFLWDKDVGGGIGAGDEAQQLLAREASVTW